MKIEKYLKIALLLSLPVLLNSCFDTDDPNSNIREESDRIVSQYLEDNNINATKSNLNYYYQPIVENPNGKDVETGDIVGIYYKISQLTGQHIDSLTASMGEPINFIHVANRSDISTPAVTNLGLTWMRTGETYRFFIPSYLAYGSYQNDTLMPANANIKMDITVAYATDSTGRANIENDMIFDYLTENEISNYQSLGNGVYYYQTAAGTGSAPETGSFFNVNYKGFFVETGNVFDQTTTSPATFQMSTPVRTANGGTIQGFSMGIKEMVKGEKGVVLMPSAMAYGNSGNFIVLPFGISQAGIPPFSPLGFDLEMIDN